MLVVVSALQIVGVAVVGGMAREYSKRRTPPPRVAAEHLIDLLSLQAKVYELDGNAVYPPGDGQGLRDRVYYLESKSPLSAASSIAPNRFEDEYDAVGPRGLDENGCPILNPTEDFR